MGLCFWRYHKRCHELLMLTYTLSNALKFTRLDLTHLHTWSPVFSLLIKMCLWKDYTTNSGQFIYDSQLAFWRLVLSICGHQDDAHWRPRSHDLRKAPGKGWFIFWFWALRAMGVQCRYKSVFSRITDHKARNSYIKVNVPGIDFKKLNWFAQIDLPLI